MELLLAKQINNHNNQSLLQKLGECIASSICFTDSPNLIKEILNKTQKDSHTISKYTLKVYLVIILRVMKDKKFLNQKQKASKVADVFAKTFNPDLMALHLVQFPRDQEMTYPDETLSIGDQIMSLVILVLTQHYINTKTKFLTKNLKDKNLEEDTDKKRTIHLIQSNLKQNCFILKDAYLTMMLIACKKIEVYQLLHNQGKPDFLPSV